MSHLNDRGQVVRVVPPLGAARVVEYDALGAVARDGLDLNGNGALDLASAEPVTLHSRRFEKKDARHLVVAITHNFVTFHDHERHPSP